MNTLSWVRSSGLSALVSASCSVSQQHNSSSTCTLSAEETWWALLNLHRASQDIRRCQVAKQELSQPMMHRLGFLLCGVVFLLNSLQQPALSLAPRSVHAVSKQRPAILIGFWHRGTAHWSWGRETERRTYEQVENCKLGKKNKTIIQLAQLFYIPC